MESRDCRSQVTQRSWWQRWSRPKIFIICCCSPITVHFATKLKTKIVGCDRRTWLEKKPLRKCKPCKMYWGKCRREHASAPKIINRKMPPHKKTHTKTFPSLLPGIGNITFLGPVMTVLSTAALKDSFYFMETLMWLLICGTKIKALDCLRAIAGSEAKIFAGSCPMCRWSRACL